METQESKTSGVLSFFPLLIIGLCAVAYGPAMHIGFIADDFVIMQRTQILEHDPWYLFNVVPENFRSTSYVVFEFFRKLVGYDARFFYLFTILIHIVNCWLFYKLLSRLGWNRFIPLTSTLLFAVFQAPQEAVMWLAAMNEVLQALFILSALLFWDSRRYFWSVMCFALALVSKESAAILLLMIPLWDLARGRRPFPRAYLWYAIPFAMFAAVFFYTVSHNFMLTSKSYAVGFQAPIVIVKTLFRLTVPWLYIVVAILAWKRLQPLRVPEVAGFLAWLTVPMLPYMFINYQHHLPSRQLYMVSMVLVLLFARLLDATRSPRLQWAFVIGFILFNIQYLWLKKLPQFHERSASTTELVKELKSHTPTRVLMVDFPYPEIGIARAATLAAPGWSPELIEAEAPGVSCPECLVLRWDRAKMRYAEDRP